MRGKQCYIRWVEEHEWNRRHTTAWKDTLEAMLAKQRCAAGRKSRREEVKVPYQAEQTPQLGPTCQYNPSHACECLVSLQVWRLFRCDLSSRCKIAFFSLPPPFPNRILLRQGKSIFSALNSRRLTRVHSRPLPTTHSCRVAWSSLSNAR